jgi:integrase
VLPWDCAPPVRTRSWRAACARVRPAGSRARSRPAPHLAIEVDVRPAGEHEGRPGIVTATEPAHLDDAAGGRRVGKAALVPPSVANIRWHDLRGTFGSRLLRKTRNPAWVQKALGHTSINTTMRHYAHVLNDDVRQAKAEMQGAQTTSPAVQKLRGKLQGRTNLKVVG